MIKKAAIKTIERMNNLSIQELKTWFYFILLKLSLQIDKMHCNYLTQFYGTEDYFLSHMRGGIAIGVSLIFGIIDLVLAYCIYKNAKKIPVVITFFNGRIKNVRGLTRILQPVALSYLIIAIVSILYDLYEIIFIHLL